MSEIKASRTLTIPNQLGLHARAAARFAKTIAPFSSSVRVSHGDVTVDGRSILGLMMLAASLGTEITITAEGIDALQTLDALTDLISKRLFDENQ